MKLLIEDNTVWIGSSIEQRIWISLSKDAGTAVHFGSSFFSSQISKLASITWLGNSYVIGLMSWIYYWWVKFVYLSKYYSKVFEDCSSSTSGSFSPPVFLR